MGGVTTYQPPDAAAPDIGRADAAYAIHELIAHTARRCGYSAAQARAVRRMTELVDDFLITFAQSSAQFAVQSNRQSPTVHDMLNTYDYLGMDTSSLVTHARDATQHRANRRRIERPKPRHGSEPWANPMVDFLPSDDEEGHTNEEPSIWKTLMNDIVPEHLPQQPPRHCWMFTPVYATQMLSELPMLQLVNRKLDNARLVETSLRRLIRETDKAALPELEPKVREEIVEMAVDTPDIHPEVPRQSESVQPHTPIQAENCSFPAHDAAASEPSSYEPVSGETESETAVPMQPTHATDPSSEAAPEASRTATHTSEATANPAKLLDTKKPLLRAVNYKSSWYAALASNDSRLPSANLYTARLRGTADDGGMAKRPRRFLV